jgi:hypothetical protein
MMKKRFWTEEELETVKRMYPDHPTAEVAEKIGRSVGQVYNQAFLLNLHKSPEYMKVERQRSIKALESGGRISRFKKGQVPPNKGKKMPEHVYQKAKATMFKKGNIPHNTNYDGHIRISKDGYQEIRVRKGKYRLLHLHNWEKVNGKLPKGHCLWNKDGNKLNTDPSNWELITRAENMRRNTVHRYPKEIKEVIRMKAVLTRKINKHEKQN